MPAIQTIFSSAPGFDEARDRRRRNIGFCIALINIFGLAAFLYGFDVDIERATQGVFGLLVAAGVVYWIARKADRGFGLAVLAGTGTFFVLCAVMALVVAVRSLMAG